MKTQAYSWKGTMSGCRLGETVVSRLGSETSFSHQAAPAYFGERVSYGAAATIEEVFRSVERDRSQFGMVPLENSCEGPVGITLDLLSRYGVKIYGEYFLKVRHFFLSMADGVNAVERIYSHPMAFNQCRVWMNGKLPGKRVIYTGSTSEAASMAAMDSVSGCVGSREAGNAYGLRKLGRDIQDCSDNMTRFAVISKSESPFSCGPAKTSLLFILEHRPGALMRVMDPASRRGINILRIESRPIKHRRWEYLFFMDLDGHVEKPDVRGAVLEMDRRALFLKVLGSYARGGELSR